MRGQRELAALLAAVMVLLCACAAAAPAQPPPAQQAAAGTAQTVDSAAVAPEEEPIAPRYIEAEIVSSAASGTQAEAAAQDEDVLELHPEATDAAVRQRLVVIDPGHQAEGNYDTEPIGPGASEQKIKVAAGTHGVVSGLQEYELTLQISLLLQAELEARGYAVALTRTAHDVDISNAERAAMANGLGADAFVRVHANGSESETASGAMTICQTADNPYSGALHAESYALSSCVLDALVEKTGCKKEYIWQTDTMTGINWSQVPVTIVEVGYMTNPDEDALMATQDYQKKIAAGIADGIDAFFAAQTQ